MLSCECEWGKRGRKSLILRTVTEQWPTNFEGNNMLKRNKANNSWPRILFVESVTFVEVAKEVCCIHRNQPMVVFQSRSSHLFL
jgi:hypothetical protein